MTAAVANLVSAFAAGLRQRLGPVAAWLVMLADSENPCAILPPRINARQVRRLLCLADRHGVLPSAVMHLEAIIDGRGAGAVVGTPMDAAVLTQSIQSARGILVERTGLSLLLRTQLEEIAQALAAAGLRAVVMKGPQFADRLYRDASLRLFTDIDLLVAREDLSAAERALGDLGYSPAKAAMKYDEGYGERTWRLQGAPGGPIELHWDMVNSPTLRRGVSLGLEDLMFEPDDRPRWALARPTPAAMMLMAAVHAAASHSFDRIQMLCDVLQLTRGPAGEVDCDFLGEQARRSGAVPALSMALDLCYRIFGEATCLDLLRRCDIARPGWLTRRLITRGLVVRAHHPVDSFRRQLFRSMLKRA